jgi:biotin carboxylase
MKVVLLLGIGPAQSDLAALLKSRGCRVIGCAHRPAGLALPLLDAFEQVDIRDVEGLVRTAERYRADAVLSVGSDLAVPSMAVVSARLGLPALVDPETARVLHHKELFRNRLKASGLEDVPFQAGRAPEDFSSWTLYPCVVKPVDSQGQRGVGLVEDPQELEAAVAKALAWSASGRVLVEAYAQGVEVSVNAFLGGGKVRFLAVSQRVASRGPAFGVPLRHIYPWPDEDPVLVRAVRAKVKDLVRGFGLREGPVYFQMKAGPEGVCVLEMTPRLDGCHLWRLVHRVDGVDLLGAYVDCVQGFSPNLSDGDARPATGPLSLSFFLSPPGVPFRSARHPAPPGSLFVCYYYREGEMVAASNGVLEKAGYALHPATEAPCASR